MFTIIDIIPYYNWFQVAFRHYFFLVFKALKLNPTTVTDGLEERSRILLVLIAMLSALAFAVVLGPNPLDEDPIFFLMGGGNRYYRCGYGLIASLELYHNWILVAVASYTILAYVNSARMWLQLIA